MSSGSLDELEAAFNRAIAMESAEREAWLGELRAEDAALAERLEALLAADGTGDDRLREPVAGAVGDLAGQISDPWVGRQLGAWRIEKRIASGGMGAVFVARRTDDEFEQRVAVKIMGAQLVASDAMARFRAERQILADLNHRFIASLIDGGTTDEGLPFLVMEYIVGTPVDRYCDEHRLSVNERLGLFLKICEAADYAHRKLVVHRDLKPSNILVDEHGVPKLLDFGIAKLLEPGPDARTVLVTREGQQALTPEYASPEQVRGEPVSVATDVYSLGVLLYKLLCGRLPFRIDENVPGSIVRAILESEPSRPSTALVDPAGPDSGTNEDISRRRATSLPRLKSVLTGDLDNIVMATIRKEPERRYPSARALVDDIANYLAHRPVMARADTPWYRVGKFLRRQRVAVAVTAVVAAVIVVSVARILGERDRATLAAAQAGQVSDFLTRLFDSASPHQSRGETVTALMLLDEGRRQIDELDGQPRLQAELARIMGRSYAALDRTGLALPLLHRSLELKQAIPETPPLSLADTLENLSEAQRLHGEYPDAETNLRQALLLRQKALDDGHPEIARTFGRLGVVLFDLRQREEAVEALKEAMRMKTALGEDDDAVSADLLGNLAISLDSLGRYEEAIAIHRRAIELSLRHDGELHPNTAIRMGNLGLVYTRTARFEAAVEQYDRTLALSRKVFPPNHSQTAFILGARAATYKRMGRFAESLADYREAARMTREGSGPRSFRYMDRIGGLGSVLLDMARYDEAETHFAEAMGLARDLFGEPSEQLAYWQIFQGRLLNVRGRYAEAETVLRAALRSSDELGMAALLAARLELVVTLSGQQRFSEATALVTDVLEQKAEVSGESSATMVGFLTRAAAHHRAAGDYDEALRLARRAHEIAIGELPAGNWTAALATAELGYALRGNGETTSARQHLQAARRDLQATFGAGDPRVTRLAADIGE